MEYNDEEILELFHKLLESMQQALHDIMVTYLKYEKESNHGITAAEG